MRVSKLLMTTLRELSSEAEGSEGYKTLIRAGYIKKIGQVLYALMPLGTALQKSIMEKIDEGLAKEGINQIEVPSFIPEDKQEDCCKNGINDAGFGKTKRDDNYEELFIDIANEDIKSYKGLPAGYYSYGKRINLSSVHGLYNPREGMKLEGLVAGRDEKELSAKLDAIYRSASRLFSKCMVDIDVLEEDYGKVGFPEYIEFMKEDSNGDEEYICCPKCGRKANTKRAVTKEAFIDVPDSRMGEVEEIETPGVRTIEELQSFLGAEKKNIAKTLLYNVDGKIVAVVVLGDRTVSEDKVLSYLGGCSIRMADTEEIKNATWAEPGFAGPLGINADRILIDKEVANSTNLIAGANKTNIHIKNVNYVRDFIGDEGDFRKASAGDICIECGGTVEVRRGFKAGHIYSRGVSKSQSAGAKFINEDGNDSPFYTGTFFINITGLIEAIADSNHDEKGLILSKDISPYKVYIAPVQYNDDSQGKAADKLYTELCRAGFGVLLDDRDARAGVKFNDADLIGIPVRITIGKRISEGLAEIKLRSEKEARVVEIDSIFDEVTKILKTEKINNCK